MTAVEQKGESIRFTMYERARVLPQKIPELLEQYKGELTLKTDLEHPYFVYEKKRIQKNVKNPNSIEVVKNVLFGLKGLIEN